jgi:hypothetical protein
VRKTITVLVLILCCSTILNIVLFHRNKVLHRNAKITAKHLAARGLWQGTADAKRDFADGVPKWYQIGDFAVPVPPDKPGRKLATVGCIVSEYEKAYVSSYNKTTDALFEEAAKQQRSQQPAEP